MAPLLCRQPFWNVTVHARVPHSFNSGSLEFQRVAAVGASSIEAQESVLTLGNSNAAEESLIKAELVDLPDGGVVLPLAHQQFLVGLLFLEEASAPSQSALSDLTRQTLGDSSSLVRWAAVMGIIDGLFSTMLAPRYQSTDTTDSCRNDCRIELDSSWVLIVQEWAAWRISDAGTRGAEAPEEGGPGPVARMQPGAASGPGESARRRAEPAHRRTRRTGAQMILTR